MSGRQTRLASFVEAVVNIGSGFIIALILWQLLANIYGIHMPIGRNLVITSVFTVVSVTRSYLWRRYFNTRLNNLSISFSRRWYRD